MQPARASSCSLSTRAPVPCVIAASHSSRCPDHRPPDCRAGPWVSARALPDDVHGVALEPSSAEPLLSSLLQSAVAVQLLTLGIVKLAGTNPDLIRREERAYREAALIGDATPDW